MKFETFQAGVLRQRLQYQSFEPVPINQAWVWEDATINQLHHFRHHRPCVGGAMILHYDRPEKTSSFPAAAPAAKRRGRRQGRKRRGLALAHLVQNHRLHRDKLGGGLTCIYPNTCSSPESRKWRCPTKNET